MTKLHELAYLGQSIWLDYISRSLISSGELRNLIEKGLRGVTSNPSIFEKAIVNTPDYDENIRRLVAEERPVDEIYEILAIGDVKRAADVMRPVYNTTGGVDGYVSLEVNPELAHDTDDTIAEARRLFAALDRPNVMIKVPATPAGPLAIRTLISEGININVTLIFSLAHYEAAAEAYIAGLEKLAEARGDLSRTASVASFFVSRVDTAVDQMLEKMGESKLRGKIAIAIAKAIYARFRKIFSGTRWERMKRLGAHVQRPLWGSTSTKNPAYPDTLYVDSLIGPDTVNTLPPATIEAFLDHGRVAPTLGTGLAEAQDQLARLDDLGVDLDAVTQKLQDDGVDSFAKSFKTLMSCISRKSEELRVNL